jgi:L-ascorbate metabolism protein UlaG (beta-lactamase superfamily)
MAFSARPFLGPLVQQLELRPESGVVFYWLGQAGFLIDTGSHRVLIDPYLSDSLAKKYRNRGYSHVRLMAPPIEIAELPPIDYILCTHSHGDHMDGATLAPIARRFPLVRIVAPKASLTTAQEKTGLALEWFIGMDAGMALDLAGGIKILAVRAAHEELMQDKAGNQLFLGYAIEVNGKRIFHSGDTVPFDGQGAEVEALKPDVALLPVNGRSLALGAAGIAGNFTLDEATDLASTCGIAVVLAHHYGMFAFNTVEPELIDAKAGVLTGATELLRAREGIEYRL